MRNVTKNLSHENRCPGVDSNRRSAEYNSTTSMLNQSVRCSLLSYGLFSPAVSNSMVSHGGVDVWFHVFLTSALVAGEWSASCFGRFTSGEIANGTQCDGWVSEPSGGRRQRRILDPAGNLTTSPRSSSS
jgi:hypothetical protein